MRIIIEDQLAKIVMEQGKRTAVQIKRVSATNPLHSRLDVRRAYADSTAKACRLLMEDGLSIAAAWNLIKVARGKRTKRYLA